MGKVTRIGRYRQSVARVLLVGVALATVGVLTHEPAAVAGAFAALAAGLYYRPARRCLRR